MIRAASISRTISAAPMDSESSGWCPEPMYRLGLGRNPLPEIDRHPGREFQGRRRIRRRFPRWRCAVRWCATHGVLWRCHPECFRPYRSSYSSACRWRNFSLHFVAQALLPAASPLMGTLLVRRRVAPAKRVETSLDTAGTSACATKCGVVSQPARVLIRWP